MKGSMQAVSLQHRAGTIVANGVRRVRSPKAPMKATAAYGVQANKNTDVSVKPTLATRISLRVLAASPLLSEATFILAAWEKKSLEKLKKKKIWKKKMFSYLGFEFHFVIPNLRGDFAVAEENDAHWNQIVPEPNAEHEKSGRVIIRHVIEAAARQVALWLTNTSISLINKTEELMKIWVNWIVDRSIGYLERIGPRFRRKATVLVDWRRSRCPARSATLVRWSSVCPSGQWCTWTGVNHVIHSSLKEYNPIWSEIKVKLCPLMCQNVSKCCFFMSFGF